MQVVFDRTNAKKLIDDFHSLVGIRIGLFDKNYKEIYCTPEEGEEFCIAIRKNEKINQQCNMCDKKAFIQAEKTRSIYIYQCHMGLYEAVAPIIDDVVIGYIMIGQILDDHPIRHHWDRISEMCSVYGLDVMPYKQSFDKLQQVKKNRIEAIANIMCACSAYIWLKNIIRIERGGLFLRIDSYIRNNMGKKITQDEICKAIRISKTTLYNCLISNVSMPMTEYVQKIRLEKAKVLLSETNMKIHEIAEQIGIDDYNYFSRIFKKAYHTTPSNFKKQAETAKKSL